MEYSLKSRDPIDVFKAVGAIAILLVIAAFSIYYYHVEEERLQQEELLIEEETVKTFRLVIVAPYSAFVNKEIPIDIMVVDSNGIVVELREDLVEISLLTKGKTMIGIKRINGITWSRNIDLQLNNGVGEFWFKAIDIEPVTITAKQLSGETPLEETRFMFIVLRERIN
jgi:hypothetical protein